MDVSANEREAPWGMNAVAVVTARATSSDICRITFILFVYLGSTRGLLRVNFLLFRLPQSDMSYFYPTCQFQRAEPEAEILMQSQGDDN